MKQKGTKAISILLTVLLLFGLLPTAALAEGGMKEGKVSVE